MRLSRARQDVLSHERAERLELLVTRHTKSRRDGKGTLNFAVHVLIIVARVSNRS